MAPHSFSGAPSRRPSKTHGPSRDRISGHGRRHPHAAAGLHLSSLRRRARPRYPLGADGAQRLRPRPRRAHRHAGGERHSCGSRRIDHIAAGFYSHWHPDHTAGRRMYETRNWDWRGWPPAHICTPIYLPPQVAVDFTTHLGLAENFAYLQHVGLVDVRLSDAPIELGGWRIEAHPVAETYVYALLFTEIDGAHATPRSRPHRHGRTLRLDAA
ncbi:MAG: hypothetical protein R2838_14875 [Caldilineaceae bacterium]